MVLAAKSDTTVPTASLLLAAMASDPKYSDCTRWTGGLAAPDPPPAHRTSGVAASVSEQLVMLTIFSMRSGLLRGPSYTTTGSAGLRRRPALSLA